MTLICLLPVVFLSWSLFGLNATPFFILYDTPYLFIVSLLLLVILFYTLLMHVYMYTCKVRLAFSHDGLYLGGKYSQFIPWKDVQDIKILKPHIRLSLKTFLDSWLQSHLYVHLHSDSKYHELFTGSSTIKKLDNFQESNGYIIPILYLNASHSDIEAAIHHYRRSYL